MLNKLIKGLQNNPMLMEHAIEIIMAISNSLMLLNELTEAKLKVLMKQICEVDFDFSINDKDMEDMASNVRVLMDENKPKLI